MHFIYLYVNILKNNSWIKYLFIFCLLENNINFSVTFEYFWEKSIFIMLNSKYKKKLRSPLVMRLNIVNKPDHHYII